MKNALSRSALVALAALLLSSVVHAGEPAAQANEKDAQEDETPSQCLRDTGSHIRVRKGECRAFVGRSYSREDLSRTGETRVGEALRRLDTSITTGH